MAATEQRGRRQFLRVPLTNRSVQPPRLELFDAQEQSRNLRKFPMDV